MAEITPFKGLFYNTGRTGDISRVTAPPYDIIPENEKEKYYSRNEFNIIHLILGRQLPGDARPDSWHRRAAETFKDWIQKDVLTYDSGENLYIYRQEYYIEEEKKTLTGIICALKIEEPGPDCSILPHEKTLGKPREDRLNLIRASKANFSPIFGLFEDPRQELIQKAAGEAEKKPLIDFKDENEVRHTVFRLDDKEKASALRQFLKDKKVFIADGHHRYEAAARFRKEMLESRPDFSGEETFNYVMAYLVNIFDEGLTILPAHRLVKKIPRERKNLIRESLGEFFHIEEASDYEAVSLKMGESFNSGAHSFGLFYGGGYYFLTLKNSSGYGAVMDEKFPSSHKELDVCIAHGIIIDQVISGGSEMPQENLDYEKDPQKAASLVEEKKFELAIFLNPTKIEQVLDIASSGMQMPGKATYFYPKPAGGLLLRKL